VTAVETGAGTALDGPTDGIAIRYLLPPGSSPNVTNGARVERDDVLARAPCPPILAAVAAELGVPQLSEIAAMIPAVGTIVQAGASLARLRRGVRTYVARSPASGTVTGTHPIGVVTLMPDDGPVEIRARYAGTVLSSDERSLVVATPTTRLPFAYGLNVARCELSLVIEASLLAGALTTRTPIPPIAPDTALVVAHIGDVRTLSAARQRTGALLVIGSVADAVAWELCTSVASDAPSSAGMAIVVLAGPGDADAGGRAVAPLRTRNGTRAVIDGEFRALTLLDERDPAATVPKGSLDEPTIIFHEPAYWAECGTITGPPEEYALDTGMRVLAVETTCAQRGAMPTPTQNFGKSG
jgi:hypothetical protein